MKFKFKSIKQENKTNAKWKSERVFWEFQMRLINIETRFHWKIVFWHVAAGFITSVLHSTHTHTHTHTYTPTHPNMYFYIQTHSHTHTLWKSDTVERSNLIGQPAPSGQPISIFFIINFLIFVSLIRWFIWLFLFVLLLLFWLLLLASWPWYEAVMNIQIPSSRNCFVFVPECCRLRRHLLALPLPPSLPPPIWRRCGRYREMLPDWYSANGVGGRLSFPMGRPMAQFWMTILERWNRPALGYR